MDWITSRVKHLAEPDRTIIRALVHGGHVAAGFMWAAGIVILGGPLWLAAVFVGAWILGVETHDTLKYGGNWLRRRFPRLLKFPVPLLTWSQDSWWDTFQILGGASFVLVGWLFFVAFLAVYFVFVKRM